MNFCERCNIACEGERCPRCGSKKVREVREEDICLVAQVQRDFGDSLKENLEREGIPCILAPFGTGVRAKFALPLERYLLYVEYRHYDRVLRIVKEADAENGSAP